MKNKTSKVFMDKDRKSILIIDDDSRNTFALSAVLRSRGYHAMAASGMTEAFEMLQQGNICLILMDMMMPEMDGYEAIPKIRLLEACKTIPIISVTAQAMAGDREKCIAAGADDYLSKPVDVDLLSGLLNKYLK